MGGFELGSLGVPLLLISLSHGGGCPGRKVHSFNTPFASPPPAVGESDSPHPPPPLFFHLLFPAVGSLISSCSLLSLPHPPCSYYLYPQYPLKTLGSVEPCAHGIPTLKPAINISVVCFCLCGVKKGGQRRIRVAE